ncbi:putative phage tail assembly chaperone [Shewanella sp. D64]|uniref:putative phage tail assembly chaperone n=1 Tax=unclassified Shewanella TaxID=196818 RepID=UPI0022BA29BB|nr:MULTISPECIES: putative phage tail assembly chaperone [unclassified Shewanella]MEC4728849.1 putative phage tail assembly chaperone [Shewanella sp. D64]MEC4740723.1 putative phage tail assembly chaperone [Shewanella sp. E94]WBJ95318.1 putative phage tail assembly chaperone [Shewanella sp. MTB7]
MNDEEKKALPKNEAIELLKGLQGTKSVVVPVVIDGTKVHDGVTFDVSLADYNKFINASQTGKISPTASAKDFLMHTAIKKDRDFLQELLKVPGMLDFAMGKVIKAVAPEVSSTLD